jgi:hypothetical protein
MLYRVFEKLGSEFCNVLGQIQIDTAQWKVASLKVDVESPESELTVDLKNTFTNNAIKIIERTNSVTKERRAYIYEIPVTGGPKMYPVQTCGELLTVINTLVKKYTTSPTI